MGTVTRRSFLLATGFGTWAAGCAPRPTGPPTPPVNTRKAPPLPPPTRLEPGVLFREVSVPHREGDTRIWLYLPEQPGSAKVPLVVIAPAGSRLFHGMSLGDGDRPEHLPYVRAGFGVLAYDVWGHVEDEEPSDGDMIAAARAFQMSDAGAICARGALDYTLARVRNIDRQRIWTAGHSSAATTALLVAARDKRIKGCVAYAPCTNVPGRIADAIPIFNNVLPGFKDFIERTSPHRTTATLTCPVFLFHAEDDSNVPISESASFADQLRQTNPRVNFFRVPTGGHYDSMVEQGIPQAINWLRGL